VSPNAIIDPSLPPTVVDRARGLFQDSQRELWQHCDRLFAGLMIFQWLAGIAAAFWISPRTWSGPSSQVHLHIWAAVFLGGAIASLPVLMAWRRPGHALTRHTVAVAQTLTSALLIHLTGGRIETHFHIFGSLAFLAFYRDWKVLLSATAVVATDHLVRGMYLPQSVFGVVVASNWRWLEHAGWVIFEDIFLLTSIRWSLREMSEVAARRAGLEAINADIERQVAERTRDLTTADEALQASEHRFRTLCESAPIGIFLTDAQGGGLYTNPRWQQIAALSLPASLGDGWVGAVHPDDRDAVFTEWKHCARGGIEFSREFRFSGATGEVRWVLARSAATRAATDAVTGHVGTVEDITERKRAESDLATTQKELMDASRRAGMAEVATGVLHNVGNVLNSVKVSANLVADGLRRSKVSNLSKVAAMLDEHASDLVHFFTVDSRGQQLLVYLRQLADHLPKEQAGLVKETELLRNHLEHINEIVAMHQSYAKVSDVIDSIKVTELVEDALRLNASALEQDRVGIIRQYDAAPVIGVDKHRVLQILLNLIRNAKYACEQSHRTDKELTVRVTQGDDRVWIAVSDNGVGIPADNLTRIFAHGFTTRKDGHGFGLHSGALAAKEMGGALNVCSEGPDKGATFTLELPFRRVAP